MSDVWSRMARNPNLSGAQFSPDSFHVQAMAAADEISWRGEEIDAELGTGAHTYPSQAEVKSAERQGIEPRKGLNSPEADAHRELARSIDTWVTDAELSPILNSGYRRWN